MAISMKDVAKKANVSSTTVSHVINSTRYVRPETKKRVLAAIKKLDYNLNLVARSLRKGKTKTIAFVISDSSNYFYMDVARGIELVTREKGYHVVFVNSDENKKEEKKQVAILKSRGIDGIILAPTDADCSYLNKVLDKDFPIVFIDRIPSNITRDNMQVTNTEGVYEVVTYFLKKGHRRIGLVSSLPEENTMGERIYGYRKAIRNFGFEPDESLIKIGKGKPGTPREQMHGLAYKLMGQLLSESDISAVIFTNNTTGMGAYAYLVEHNVKIPEDLAVVNFDNDVWTELASPSLSAVSQYPVEIGKKASEVLLKRIKGDKSKYKTYRLKTEFILRNSC
jgi:LacI family transcriptional regulator